MKLGLWWPYSWNDKQLDKSRLVTWRDIGIQHLIGCPGTPIGQKPTFPRLVEMCADLGMQAYSLGTWGKVMPWRNYTAGYTPLSHFLTTVTKPYIESPGFGGYVVAHEDYEAKKEVLQGMVDHLKKIDPNRICYVVGNAKVSNQPFPLQTVYLHEDYVNQTGKPFGIQLSYWRKTLPKIPIPWGAILHVGDEIVDGIPYLSVPTRDNLLSWIYSAMSLGAQEIWFFPGSSGDEKGRTYLGLDININLWKVIKQTAARDERLHSYN